MYIKAIARNLWRTGEVHRYATWYEPLDEQAASTRRSRSRSPRPGDRDRHGRRRAPAAAHDRGGAAGAHATAASIAAELDAVPELEPPFLRIPGRSIPDWLEPIVIDP